MGDMAVKGFKFILYVLFDSEIIITKDYPNAFSVMAEEYPPSPTPKGVPFAWEIAGLSFREYGTAMTARGSVCLL